MSVNSCPQNVWNHTDGCTCLPNGSVTAEVDVDLVTAAEERPEWTTAKVGKQEHKGKDCTRCGTDYATCTARIMGRVPGATGACCGSCAYTGTHSETAIASPYDVGSGQSRQSDGPLDTMNLSTTDGVAREIVRMVDEGQIDMDPPYQRSGGLWSIDQRIGLVKSWIQGIPVPPVTLNDRTTSEWSKNHGGHNPLNEGKDMYAVVDGKQRIETARMWFHDEFAVPASWFPPEEVETTFDTPDGPYVHFGGLTSGGRTHNAYMVAKMPRSTARVGTVEDEAALFLLINGGGTQQTEESMARAAHIASGGR
jgi:hypothetical protein